jgi:superoxide dismutase
MACSAKKSRRPSAAGTESVFGVEIRLLGSLECPTSSSHDGGVPILAIDMWKHAYYLQYENRRADCIASGGRYATLYAAFIEQA